MTDDALNEAIADKIWTEPCGKPSRLSCRLACQSLRCTGHSTADPIGGARYATRSVHGGALRRGTGMTDHTKFNVDITFNDMRRIPVGGCSGDVRGDVSTIF